MRSRNFALAAVFALEACATIDRSPGSRGRPNAGWISHATRLADRGRGWQVLRDDAHGGQHWGTSRIVSLVQQVARATSPARSAVPLVVGDISALHGGQVPRHASHRAGRDVDLLFFTRDAVANTPVLTPEFVRYDRDGNSVAWPAPLRFDTPRNWDLIESVVRAEGVAVARVFVASWLEQLLVTNARERGRPAWVIERAEALMHQPGDALPHDDHFHVRLSCLADERASGCVDGAPLWPWLAKDWEKGDSLSADDATILAALR